MSPLETAWHGMLAFVFYYPLLMSFLWMGGALVFWWRFERGGPAYDRPPVLPGTPPVSVLIPCYNEGENAQETVSHALALDYPEFEVIAINDGSTDDTGEVLERLAAEHPRLRVVQLAQNQGKAMGLQAGALLAAHEILICIDGDALLDPHAAHWLVRHFVESPDVAAVTGNPRIRNRSTLLGRVQVGEFSSIVGTIKRAQRVFGRIFTVSGVITAFRKSAVHQVDYWSADMLTEDIDVTWKLHRAGWDVRFEPNALVWILMPETLRGLWKQRLRWAMGGAQVLLKNFDALLVPAQRFMWPLLLEMCVSVAWSYAMLLLTITWLIGHVLPTGAVPMVGSPLSPQGSGMVLGATCLLQFAFATWLDSRHDRGLGRNLVWMIWYPVAFWVINCAATVAAYPKVLARRRGKRATWVSPDRGFRP
ncbi:MAG TPA: poly-beta-1,6-N-acetyl-D-glucosamine synthase [Anaeromyxobacteraceae bacterium]|nr:poly-beta-1,6-N-acetyl-D-glucosamine synthase [Anaeromyxobacteraceae bacterium]